MRRFLVLSVALALGFASQASAQGVISISFSGDNGGGTTNQLLDFETAGFVPTSNWNLASDGAVGSLSGLINDAGGATGASVTWSSENTWGGTTGIDGVTTSDEFMVNGWLDDNGANGSLIDITGVPFASYDVYVYGSSDAGNEGRGFTTNVNGTDFYSGGFFETLSLDGSFFESARGFVDAFSATNDPTYFQISGLSGSTININGMRDTGGPALPNGSTDYRGGVSGIQIVENLNPPPTLTINRDTGNVSMESGNGFDLTGYSLVSGVGALDEDAWTSITGNFDGSGDGSISSDTWSIDTSSNNELTESTLGLGSIPAGGAINFGDGTWRQYFTEDISAIVVDDAGNPTNIVVSYVGNGGEGFAQGDFNFDGAIDGLDWPTVRDNFNTSFPGVTEVDAYYLGDLTGDDAVDLNDLLAFEAIFDAANGDGAFARLVPEPSSFILLGIGFFALFRRRGKIAAMMLVLGLTIGMTSQNVSADPIPVANHSFEDANLDSGGWSDCIDVACDGGVPDPEFWVDNPPNSGGSFAEVIDGLVDPFDGGTHHLGTAAGVFVRQDLNVTLSPNTVYTLMPATGHRDGQTLENNQTAFGLSADGVNLNRLQVTNSFVTPAGTFEDLERYVYITGASVPTGNLGVVLGSLGGGRGHFDNIRVDATPVADAGAMGLLNDLLSLEVDGSSVTLVNSAGFADSDINYYEIRSASGSLNLAGWNSLQDQDFEGNGGPGLGNGWEELGNLDGTLLAEFYLTGSSNLTGGTEIDLGSIFGGGSQDLQLFYHLDDGRSYSGPVSYGGAPTIDGDFNNDGNYDCADIDALIAEIAAGTNGAGFDLNSDGEVDTADRDSWLVEAGEANIGPGRAYLLGDATLDGFVDVSDFGVWNANKFTSTAAWCSGDFTADGVVDVSDFGAWNSNKFTASDTAAVPEPAGFGMLLVMGSSLLLLRKRK